MIKSTDRLKEGPFEKQMVANGLDRPLWVAILHRSGLVISCYKVVVKTSGPHRRTQLKFEYPPPPGPGV